MTIFALVLLGITLVAFTVLLMIAPFRHQDRISLCLVIVVVVFLASCYSVGQGAR